MTAHRVKKRTLQAWLKAGIIPGTIRTKGGRGHYRIRAPKGVTADLLRRAVVGFGGVAGLDRQSGLSEASASALPPSWWRWRATVKANVTDYNLVMRNVRRSFHGGYMLRVAAEGMKNYVRQNRKRARVTSSRLSDSFSTSVGGGVPMQ
jgi:predicted site-specific integrase-resolvase